MLGLVAALGLAMVGAVVGSPVYWTWAESSARAAASMSAPADDGDGSPGDEGDGLPGDDGGASLGEDAPLDGDDEAPLDDAAPDGEEDASLDGEDEAPLDGEEDTSLDGEDEVPLDGEDEALVGDDGVSLDGEDAAPMDEDVPVDSKEPPYPTVTPLDQPEEVVSTMMASLALMSVSGVGAAMGATAGRMARSARMARGTSNKPAGGGINEGTYWSESLLDDINVDHNRGWRTPFTPAGTAPGDTSALHRGPLTSFVDEASFVGMTAVSAKSPLLARVIGDGAPVRAMLGSYSLLLPITAVFLGIWSAVSGNGIAEPPALGLLVAIMFIGVIDGLAGCLSALAFSATVVAMGGVLDWSSVRTLMGVALLLVGPSLIASSFRSIRRAATRSASAWYERGADVLIVPLLGAYTTYNVAWALPPLGGSLFPVAESAVMLAWAVAGMLVVKIGLEEAAARWFPERMATVTGSIEWPGTTQQVVSSLIRFGLFTFISAAFIGSPWQLWVGAVVWILPYILYVISHKLPNFPRLWQVLPDGVPALGVGLLAYVVLAEILESVIDDGTQLALTSFVVLLVPYTVLGLLALVAREPREDDVRWYMRPNMTGVYRGGGVVVFIITCWLAYLSVL